MMRRAVILLLPLIFASQARAIAGDQTGIAREHCLQRRANASTAGQTACEARAAHDYDRRMNTAYRALLKVLPVGSGQLLTAAQRSWLHFRAADAHMRAALYESRQ